MRWVWPSAKTRNRMRTAGHDQKIVAIRLLCRTSSEPGRNCAGALNARIEREAPQSSASTRSSATTKRRSIHMRYQGHKGLRMPRPPCSATSLGKARPCALLNCRHPASSQWLNQKAGLTQRRRVACDVSCARAFQEIPEHAHCCGAKRQSQARRKFAAAIAECGEPRASQAQSARSAHCEVSIAREYQRPRQHALVFKPLRTAHGMKHSTKDAGRGQRATRMRQLWRKRWRARAREEAKPAAGISCSAERAPRKVVIARRKERRTLRRCLCS